MKKIGVIGRGFVGSAVEFGFSAQCGCNAIVKSYDIDESRKKDSLDEIKQIYVFNRGRSLPNLLYWAICQATVHIR